MLFVFAVAFVFLDYTWCYVALRIIIKRWRRCVAVALGRGWARITCSFQVLSGRQSIYRSLTEELRNVHFFSFLDSIRRLVWISSTHWSTWLSHVCESCVANINDFYWELVPSSWISMHICWRDCLDDQWLINYRFESSCPSCTNALHGNIDTVVGDEGARICWDFLSFDLVSMFFFFKMVEQTMHCKGLVLMASSWNFR